MKVIRIIIGTLIFMVICTPFICLLNHLPQLSILQSIDVILLSSLSCQAIITVIFGAFAVIVFDEWFKSKLKS
jgi:type III secretory pathway component EscU